MSLSTPAVRHLPESMAVAAARRLVPPQPGLDPDEAARRFLLGAKRSGLDLSMMFGSCTGSEVRHVALIVPGAGRASVVFVSNPLGNETDQDTQERAACLREAAAFARASTDLHILQSLPEPHEPHAIAAFERAGFLCVGELSYLKRPLQPGAPETAPALPGGVSVRTVTSLEPGSRDRDDLIRALDRSYIDTRDCPALCGMRDTGDVLDSHAATGRFDPNLWWLVSKENQPEGCVLISEVPDSGTFELVYLGLGPDLRGLGLGKALMHRAINQLECATPKASHGALVCAVDRTNTPAMNVYESCGFAEFSRRKAFVLPLVARSS